ncbi:MAG: SEC-C domain-containing protein [Desulfobacteraceae bacterium]|nr:MAG: SEC-C domain-containing protein [Desulfobacteraceae bacterium]
MAKLGSKKKPARGHVQSFERAQQILKICDDNGWIAVIGIESDKPENISEVNRLLYPPEPIRAERKAGRNDPCPCGSGKKFKKCCMYK